MIASSSSRLWLWIGALLLTLATLIPHSTSVAALVAVVVVLLALVISVLELAYLAGREVPVGEGDAVRLDNGVHGRVRGVRWGYTIVETEAATVLVPNHRLQQRRPIGRL